MRQAGERHGAVATVGVWRTACRLLMAEHAWQRAQPAETVLASIPRIDM
jgi:hypothetical protein